MRLHADREDRTTQPCLEPEGIGIVSYRGERELTFYLRALEKLRQGRLVVVLALAAGLKPGISVFPRVRFIQTTEAGGVAASDVVGCFVPDPLLAVRTALKAREANEGVILLFPTNWRGDPPDVLVREARAEQKPQRQR